VLQLLFDDVQLQFIRLISIGCVCLASWKHQFSNLSEVGPWTIFHAFCSAAYCTSASDPFIYFVRQQFSFFNLEHLSSSVVFGGNTQCCITIDKST
jgi:hypothetical protein